jgi:hypothetical protein
MLGKKTGEHFRTCLGYLPEAGHCLGAHHASVGLASAELPHVGDSRAGGRYRPPALTCGADPVRCDGWDGSSNMNNASQNAVRRRNFMALPFRRGMWVRRTDILVANAESGVRSSSGI